MTYTLHGYPGTIVFLLAILAGMHILTGIETWLRERISLDLHPLWHVIPRRFKIRLRWDRPGATVQFGAGRRGHILSVCHADDVDQVLLIQPWAPDGDAYDGGPEWVACSGVTGEWESLSATAQEVPSK